MTPPDQALLAAMAREAADVRSRLDHAASAFGGWIGALPDDLRAGALGGAQAFDEIGQRLDSLATLLAGLAEGGTAAELIAAVPLAEMAARLDGVGTSEPVAAGDLVLFE